MLSEWGEESPDAVKRSGPARRSSWTGPHEFAKTLEPESLCGARSARLGRKLSPRSPAHLIATNLRVSRLDVQHGEAPRELPHPHGEWLLGIASTLATR